MALEMQNFEALSPPVVKKNNLVDITVYSSALKFEFYGKKYLSFMKR